MLAAVSAISQNSPQRFAATNPEVINSSDKCGQPLNLHEVAQDDASSCTEIRGAHGAALRRDSLSARSLSAR
jgi:hypothetical protein